MNNLTTIVKEGQRVLTTQQLAEVYETDAKNISKNFNRNNERFQYGKHYFRLEGEELQEFKGIHLNDESLKYVSTLYLWTEKGADRHCKILDTDKAWEQFDNLEETYFGVKEELPQLSKELQAIFALDGKQQRLEHDVKDLKDNMPLFNIDCEELQKEVKKKAVKCLGGFNQKAYYDKSLRARVFGDIQREIKRQFDVNSYKAIKRSQLDIAIEIIEKYEVPFVLKDEINLANSQMAM